MTDTPQHDPINPSHYQGDSVMSFIEQFDLSFCLGNTVKYVARAKTKNGLEDLKKARWYLDREIRNSEPEDIDINKHVLAKQWLINALKEVASESKGGVAYWFNRLVEKLERT